MAPQKVFASKDGDGARFFAHLMLALLLTVELYVLVSEYFGHASVKPNFPTVTHPTAGMPQKLRASTAALVSSERTVIFSTTNRTFGIDRLDADVLASVFEECSSHSWSSKIKAGPSIFARRTSVRASTTLARVVPKSVCAPQCFDFKSYFFVWWESWVKMARLLYNGPGPTFV